MIRNLVAYGSGLVFAVGLALGGMTQPARVIGFLDVFGRWDPSLMFVMGGAVGVYSALYFFARSRHMSMLGAPLQIPKRRDLTPALVGGSALFGIGWGLAGFCPGPGVTASISGAKEPLVFVAAMLAGMALHRLYTRITEKRRAASEDTSEHLVRPTAS